MDVLSQSSEKGSYCLGSYSIQQGNLERIFTQVVWARTLNPEQSVHQSFLFVQALFCGVFCFASFFCFA